jgi:tRNA dimethylallyltransferase
VSPRLIAIVGPTASGKSDLALDIASRLGGEIVSCDSRQVYRGLDIGSAKPTAEERRLVPHHLLDVVDPDQPFSAADYARLARQALAEIAARGRISLVVGGTGLYLRALLDGLFEGPARDPDLRRRLEAIAERGGGARLFALLSRADPQTASRLHERDRVRVIRALEVFRCTGRPISSHQAVAPLPLQGFERLVLGLCPERPALRRRVEARTSRMIEAGLMSEVAALLARGYPAGLPPLQAIGYRQVVAVLEGRLPRERLEAEIVTATMRYAKRQMTWFRHQTRPIWCPDQQAALGRVEAWLGAAGGAPGPPIS